MYIHFFLKLFKCFTHVLHYPEMQECYNKHLADFRSIICEVVAYERLKTKENF